MVTVTNIFNAQESKTHAHFHAFSKESPVHENALKSPLGRKAVSFALCA
jgi:hypothetical protein